MSRVSGVELSAETVPEVGTVLAIGQIVGRVVRHLEGGFAVQFVERQSPYDLEKKLQPADDRNKLRIRFPVYFSCVEIELKVVLSLVPRLETMAMIASETPAAISPYSIAVAPESSFRNRTRRLFTIAFSKAA